MSSKDPLLNYYFELGQWKQGWKDKRIKDKKLKLPSSLLQP